MADQFTESITFKADGLPQITDGVRDLFEQIEAARKRQEQFTDALSAGGYAESLRQLDSLRRKNEAYTASVLSASRANERLSAVQGGDYLRKLREESKVRDTLRRVEVAERADRLRLRREELAGGDFLTAARERVRLTREEAQIAEGERRHERRAELEARYGRRLGGLAAGAERFAGAGRVGLAGLGLGSGLILSQARAGFAGTAEQHRLDTELMLTQRSLAGAFKPAVEAAEGGLRRLRRVLDGLSERQQDYLMYGTFGAAAMSSAALANAASKVLLGQGIGSAVGGLLGRAGGGAAASAGASLAAQAGGAAAGSAAGGAAGKAAAAAGAGAGAMSVLGPAGLLTAGLALLSQATPDDQIRTLFEQNPELKGKSDDELLKRYEERKKSENFVERNMEAFAAPDAGLYEIGRRTGLIDRKRDDLRSESDRLGEYLKGKGLVSDGGRRVTPAGGGYEELGSGFNRVTAARSMLDALDPGQPPAAPPGMTAEKAGALLNERADRETELARSMDRLAAALERQNDTRDRGEGDDLEKKPIR